MSSTRSNSKAPGGPLVSADWLAANLGILAAAGARRARPAPELGAAARQARRVRPGAHPGRRCSSTGSTTSWPPRIRCRCRLPAPRTLQARAGELGVGDGDLVVTYDDYYGIFAARVAWAFRLYGAESRVLDGGWSTWREEGRPVDEVPVQPPARRFTARAAAPTAANARERSSRPAARRARARRRAAASPVPRRAGRWRTPATSRVRAVFPTRSSSTARPGCGRHRKRSRGSPTTPGSTPARAPGELIATCGSGVSATVALMALERIGVHCDGVYDGSFNEWSAAARPVAYGRAA